MEAAGSSLDKVLTRRIYIIPLQYFRKVMEVWDRSVFQNIWCEMGIVADILSSADTLSNLILFLLVLG